MASSSYRRGRKPATTGTKKWPHEAAEGWEPVAMQKACLHQQWGAVDPAPRLAILAAMPEHGTITSATIGSIVGKHQGSIDQMLFALKTDGLVDCSMVDGRRMWCRTKVPIPASFTSTAAAKDASLYDDTALCKALGVPLKAPPVPGYARLIKAK